MLKNFGKINLISALYALIFVVITEGMTNVGRVQATTGYSYATSERMVSWGTLLIAMVLACGCIFLVHTWMKARPSVFWSVLLWFPYAIAIVAVIGWLFPNSTPADSDNYGAGLLILGLIVVYPFLVGLSVLIGVAWPSRSCAKDKDQDE